MVVTGLSRIHQISIRAHDIERAVTFYRDSLGPEIAVSGAAGNWRSSTAGACG